MKALFEKSGSLTCFFLRLSVGITFILHGSQKIFGAFGGPGLHGFARFLAQQGVPPFLSYLAAFFELLGGISLLFGIATEIGALLIFPVMAFALFGVHLKNGFFIQNQGFEYPFNLMFACLALMAGGPGKFYLWDPFHHLRLKNKK